MSVASRIQEIETHIGDIYDTLEVGGTDLTDLNKNIVNINSSLKDRYKYFLNNGVEVIWNNWEKVIGEGTEFTLENTIQAPMKVNLKGNTYQKSTTGKNLIAPEYIINGTFLHHSDLVNGTYTETSNTKYRTIRIPNLPAGTYTFSIDWEYTARILRIDYDGVTTTLSQNVDTYTFTTTTTGLFGLTFRNTDAANFLDSDFKVQIESGSEATDYEEYTGGIASPNPDYPQDIQVVSGDNTIEVVGKNLLSPNFSDYNVTDGTYGYIQITNESEDLLLSLVEKDSSIDISGIFFGFSGNGINANNGINWAIGNGDIKGYEIGNVSTAKYQYISFYPKNETTFNKIFNRFNVMVRKSNTSNEYQQYQKESYPVNLGDIELCKIGDYQDYFYKDNGKWYLHKEIGKVVLDGSENWSKSASMSVDGYFGAYATNYHWGVAGVFANKNNFIINYFLPHDNTTGDFQFISSTGYACYLKINDSIANSVENLKTWLSTHNTEIYYVLATPTTTEITDTTLLSQLEAIKYSYDDQTNISQVNNDMPFKLKVTALKNI